MVDFSNIKNIEIPEGNVKSISSGGIVLWQSSKVPSEYQEVEYIGNSGTQYLNTGFNPNFSNGFTIEIEYTPTDLSNRGCLLSNYQANNHISIELASGTANQRVYINSGAIDYNVSGTTLNKNKGIVSYSNGTVTNKINENVGTRSGTFTGITGQPLYMFVDYMIILAQCSRKFLSTKKE